MKKALLFLVLAAGLGAGSCEQKYADPDPRAAGYDYYPLAVGDFRIYNVTDIKFRNNVGDTTRYQMRERVDTTFTDQTNTLSYKVIRSIRPNENSTWQDDSVMVVTKSASSVQLTKDNTKHVKLVFPVKSGKSWQGDAFNSNLGENQVKETYRYVGIGEPFSIGGRNYNESVTVEQGRPHETEIMLDDRKEVYVQDLGMVYRLFTRIIYCNNATVQGCPFGVGYKLQGHERHEVLVSHGKR